MSSPLIKTIELDFVHVKLYEEYVISTIKEGVLIDKGELEVLYEIFDIYYPDKKFGYISDRKFDYTVNPTCYLKSSQYPRLVGMAALCHNEKSYQMAQFERAFIKRPMEVFYSKEESIKWILNLLKD